MKKREMKKVNWKEEKEIEMGHHGDMASSSSVPPSLIPPLAHRGFRAAHSLSFSRPSTTTSFSASTPATPSTSFSAAPPTIVSQALPSHTPLSLPSIQLPSPAHGLPASLGGFKKPPTNSLVPVRHQVVENQGGWRSLGGAQKAPEIIDMDYWFAGGERRLNGGAVDKTKQRRHLSVMENRVNRRREEDEAIMKQESFRSMEKCEEDMFKEYAKILFSDDGDADGLRSKEKTDEMDLIWRLMEKKGEGIEIAMWAEDLDLDDYYLESRVKAVCSKVVYVVEGRFQLRRELEALLAILIEVASHEMRLSLSVANHRKIEDLAKDLTLSEGFVRIIAESKTMFSAQKREGGTFISTGG